MRLFKRIKDVNREKYIVPKGVQDVTAGTVEKYLKMVYF